MSDLPFTLHQLRVLVAIAHLGSVTAAARQLHVTQPAASLALTELERKLGIPLFERLRGRLLLTSEGELLVGKAWEILELAENTAFDLASARSGGTLRLGASTSIGNYILPAPLCSFQADHPRVRVHLSVDITETIVDQVANRAVALGFVEGPCHQPGLEVERFRPDELVVVCAPEHRWATLPSISLSELSEERVILRTAGGTRDVVDRTLARHGLALRPNIEFGHTEAIKTAVERGQGVSILSRVTCAQELRAGVLAETRLAGVRFARWLYRVSLAGRRANPLVASFLAHLEAQLEIVYPTADWDDAE